MKKNRIYISIIVLIAFTLIQVGLFNTIISFGASNTQVVADGTYYIESAIDSQYVFDVSAASKENEANVTLYKKNGLTHH